MVLTEEVDLPMDDELEVEEVNLSQATLMSAGPWLGKLCESINNEFMLCRFENNDPRPCVDLGKQVTRCTMEFFQRVKSVCYQEFKQFAHCVDKSSSSYEPWFCRKTMAVWKECAEEKLCLPYPGFGYFTRGRIHTAGCFKDPPEPPCPCHPKITDNTPSLPDCKPRPPPRFGGRLFWSTE